MLQKKLRPGKLRCIINALWKPDLNEQKDFDRLVYLEMVSHRATNDIIHTPTKEVHFFFFLV